MGNLGFKEKFDTAQKEGYAKLSFTQQVLFDEELVNIFLEDMHKKLGIDKDVKWDELFSLTNVQKNVLEERNFEDALATHLSENYVAGFQTAESLLQNLKEQSNMEKFFSVWTSEDVKKFTEVQRKKFFLIYGLFMKKTESKNNSLTFFEYIEKFLAEGKTNARQQLGLEVGLKFSLSILKEIRHLSPAMLQSSLAYLHQALCDTTPESLYDTDKESLLYDSSINDARTFMIELISDPNTPISATELCYKIILRLFIARASVEDALVLLNLQLKFPEHASKIDLRDEIRALPSLEGNKQAGGPAQTIEFIFSEQESFEFLSYQSRKYSGFNSTHSLCTDGTHIFHYSSERGLFKLTMSGGEMMMPGLIIDSNEEESVKAWGDNARMLYFNNRIYVRSFDDKSKPFHVVNPDTLKIDPSFPEVKLEEGDGITTMNFKEEADKAAGRTLKQSPFFTDGNFFYVVSQKKHTEENEGDESVQLVVEVFNPSQKFEFIRSFVLFKNEQKDLFVKEDNSLDFIMKSHWVTNGKYLMISTESKTWVFDINNGIKIKAKVENLKGKNLIHNYFNQSISVFSEFEVKTGNLSNFKAANISQNENTAKNASEIYQSYKDKYVGSAEIIKPLNLVQKIMRKQEGLQKRAVESKQLPENSASLIQVVLLSYINEKSEEFDRQIQEESNLQNKEDFYLPCFKYPNATYLTSELFECLDTLIEHFSNKLVNSQKTEAEIADQYSFMYCLKVLVQNVKALSFTGITLTDILDKEGYQHFLNVYNNCIASMIENGYTKDFETGNAEGELISIWQGIYKSCQDILADSMDLIYADTSEILLMLSKTLKKEMTAKEEENCSFSLRFLSKEQNLIKLLSLENIEQLGTFKSVFQSCSFISASNVEQRIRLLKFTEDLPPKKPFTLLEKAAHQFVCQTSVQFLQSCSNQYVKIAQQQKSKKTGLSAAAKEKMKKENELLKQYEHFLNTVFSSLSREIISLVNSVKESVTNEVQSKNKEFFTEEIAQKYLSYSKRVDGFFCNIANSFILYVQALPELCNNSHLIASVSDTCLEVVRAFNSCLDIVNNKYAAQLSGKISTEDSEEDCEDDKNKYKKDDKFAARIKELSRQICWLTGGLAHSLVVVKPEAIKEDKTKNEEAKEKMTRLLMDSKLLSGGIENRHMNLFSQVTKDQMIDFLTISNDNTLLELLTVVDAENEQDQILHAAIVPGKNVFMDHLIEVLQFRLIQKAKRNMQFAFALTGGQQGLILSRAAFGPLIKFSSHQEDLINLVDELDQVEIDVEEETPENKILKRIEYLTENREQAFSKVEIQWTNANKMRMWMTEKKNNLRDKIEKREKATFLEKKKSSDEEKKKKEEEGKEAEVKSDKPKVVEEKAFEEKAPEEEIIDTSSKPKEATAEKTSEQEETKDEEGAVKLSAEEDEQLLKIVDTQYQKELDDIFAKIVQKAEFLLKMQVPESLKSQEESTQDEVTFARAPSYFSGLEGISQEEKEKMIAADYDESDWQTRLKQWRSHQQSQGVIKDVSELRKDIFESGNMSVLAILQSPITSDQFSKKVESVFLNGCKRMAGLYLFSKVINTQLSDNSLADVTNWMVSGIRNGSNNYSHYLDNIQGCGNHIEYQIRIHFFSILANVLNQLKKTKSKEEAIRLLDALQWKFTGRDFSSLQQLDIFKVLRFGDGSRTNILKRAWGHALTQKVGGQNESSKNLSKELLLTFENLFLNAVSRIVSNDLGEKVNVKLKGTSIPQIERAKSIVDSNTSENFLGSAFEVLFKELDRYVAIMGMFEGIDWATYCNVKNKEKKNEAKEVVEGVTCSSGYKLQYCTVKRPRYGSAGFICNICRSHVGDCSVGYYTCKDAHGNCDFDCCLSCYKGVPDEEADTSDMLLDDEREDVIFRKQKGERKKARQAAKEKKEQEEKKAAEQSHADQTEETKDSKETPSTSLEEVKIELMESTDKKEESQEEFEEVIEKFTTRVDLGDGDFEDIEEERKVRRPKRKAGKVAKEEAKGEASDKEKEDDEDGEKNEKDAASDEAVTQAKKHLESMAENEMKLISKIYAETFIRRILRLIEIFTSLAQTSPQPLAMVSKVANPYMLFSLINLFVTSAPRTQMLSLRIIQNLTSIGIPTQLFESTMNLLLQNKNSFAAAKILTGEFQVKFENSQFLDFFFKYLIFIRRAMYFKQSIQSQGAYEISQEIARFFRNIHMSTDVNRVEWKTSIETAVKNGFASIEKLQPFEQDALFALQVGGDFTRISIGNPAITSTKQLFVALGFSETDITNEIKTEDLAKHCLYPQQTNEKQNLVGFFFDPDTKDKQEIIFVAPHDVKPVLDLDLVKMEAAAKNCAILDVEILKHLVAVLIDDQNKNFALKVQLIKTFQSMMELLPKEFTELLDKENLTGKLANFFLNLASQYKHDPAVKESIIPVNWLESKATNMRVAAVEYSVQLQADIELNCQVVQQKQLVISTVDKKTNNFVAQNVYLLSAINLHRVNAQTKLSVHISPEHAPNRKAKAIIQNGLVLVEGEKLNLLDEEMLSLMQGSQAILTFDIRPKDFFTRMVKLAIDQNQEKKESETDAELKQRQTKWQNILNCVVFIVTKDDWQRIRDFGDPAKGSIVKDEWLSDKNLSQLDHFLDQLRKWGGVDTDKLLFHFLQCENFELATLQKELPAIMEKISTEEKEYNEKIKDLEKENQNDQLAAVKTARSDLLAQRAKTVEERKSELFKATESSSIVEKLAKKALEEGPEVDHEIEVFDLLKGQKDEIEKNVIKVIEDQIAKLGDAASSDEQKAKSEAAMKKQYFTEIFKFDKTNLSKDYEKTLKDLLVAYSKITLIKMLEIIDYNIILPFFTVDLGTQKKFSCFIKSSMNQATLTRQITGQKTELKKLKQEFRKLINFALKEGGENRNWVRRFIMQDILKAGFTTFESLKNQKPQAASTYFSTEEKGIQELNPYLLKYVIKVCLDNRSKLLQISKTILPTMFSMCLAMVVKFWNTNERKLVQTMLHSCMQIVFFVNEYMNLFAKSGVFEAIVNNPLLTKMASKINFENTDEQPFSEEQRLILEIYLALMNMYSEQQTKKNVTFDSSLENTKGILMAKKALQIVKEKDDFSFLLYQIHLKSLKDHELKSMNTHFQTHHPAFDVKTVGKYSINQVQRMVIKFSDKCELKPYTFFGLASDAKGTDIQYFTQTDLKKKEMDLSRSHYYTFYPIKRQVAISFGEERRNRAGLTQTFDTPQMAASSFEIKPVHVNLSKNASMIINDKGAIYSCGRNWGGSDQATYTHLPLPQTKDKKDRTCIKMASAPKRRFVLSNDNLVFYTGSRSKQLSLPEDSNKEKWQQLKFSKEQKEEDFEDKVVVDLACGNHYSLFVTSKGNLYAMGQQFWDKFQQEVSDGALQKVTLAEGWEVQRVWACPYRTEILALIEVKTANGIEYYSAGSSEFGLLGQGTNDKSDKIKESKPFGLLATEKDTQFKQISVGHNFVLAIDQHDQLWAWGSNSSFQTGIPVEYQEGIYKPTKVPFVETMKLKVIRVSAGNRHGLVQAVDETGKKRMFSLGKGEDLFRIIGVAKELATELPYHELTTFNDIEIIDFAANKDYSVVIMAGEDKPTDNLYTHKLPAGEAKGVIHFYKNEENLWTYLNEEQYDAAVKEGRVPDVCFATKHPIKDIEKIVETEGALPDLKELEKQLISDDKEPSLKRISSLTDEPIKDVSYIANVRINGEDLQINLLESELRTETTQYDLNPMLLIRFGRALKETAKLPTIQQVDDEKGFDYDKFNKMNFTQQKEMLEYDLYNSIVLDPIKIKCPSHPCELKFNDGSRRGGWGCDAIKQSSRQCMAQGDRGNQGYYCDSCNFDMCLTCVKVDLFIDSAKSLKTKEVEEKPKTVNAIDLTKIYPLSTKYGFSIETIPDFKYIINDKLIEQTKEQYIEFISVIKKFPKECTNEFLYEMNRSLKTVQKSLKEIDTEKDFKVNDMTFKDDKLKKLPEKVKKQILKIYWEFNLSFVQMAPYLVQNPPKPFQGQKVKVQTAASLFKDVKQMILTTVKMKFVDQAIEKLPTGNEEHITIKRNAAMRFEETGKVDHEGKYTVFSQIWRQIKKKSAGKFTSFRQNKPDNFVYRVTFAGEASIDAGGPFRESLTNMVRDLEVGTLPLLVKSPNNKNDHGDNRECFVINSLSKTPTHADMFRFLGVLIGYSFRSKGCMPFNLAPIFWKQLTEEELGENDIKGFDTYSWQVIQDLRKHSKELDDVNFQQAVDQTFTTVLVNGQEVELCENGKEKSVTKENYEEFIKLLLRKRFDEGKEQMVWIKEGVKLIIDFNIMSMLNWEEVEVRSAGEKIVDIEVLKSITQYNGCSATDKVIVMFWNVLSAMSEEHKQMYLKFVWGRQRLPSDCSQLRYKHSISFESHRGDTALPVSHTCFFTLDLPNYSTEEILRKRITTAMEFCGEIDGDGSPNPDREDESLIDDY